MDLTTNNAKVEAGISNSLSLKEFLNLCFRKWPWFLLSLVICLGAGYLYVKCQEPVYERSEDILIKDQEAGGGIGGMSSAFASMGLISGNTNVYNELISITSPAVLAEVIDRLHLDVNYTMSGFFHGTTLYGASLPFNVRFVDLDLQEAASFNSELNPDGSLRLYDFVSYTPLGKKVKHDQEIKGVKIGDTVKTPVGKIVISRNEAYDPAEPIVEEGKPVEIAVKKMEMQSAIEVYQSKLTGDLKDDYADVIVLSMKDVNVQRAVDVLTTILNVYNEDWVADKNKIAKATSVFIEERLRIIERELGEVDTSVAEHRSSTGTINLQDKGKALLDKGQGLEQQIVELTNKLALCRYMYDDLKDSGNKYNIIPINTGAQSEEVELQINTYNTLLLSRNALENSSSSANPLVKDYDEQLANMRGAILKGMSNNIMQLESLIASTNKELDKAESFLRSAPIQTLPLLSEQRQQSVKQNLYLFLLEKREENELGQKFTADNTRLITPPMGSLKPVSPKKLFIMLFAFVMGWLIPLVTLYIQATGDTKVRAKKDLEKLKVPFAGEIPQVGKPAKLKTFEAMDRLKHRKDEKPPLAVVQEGKRDVVNEAFRVIRSNIDFMAGRHANGAEVIMLTSFNPGSGKSFISYNLALSFAIKKKRVLLIDCDLRHGSSSMYVGMPSKGITNYLTDSTDDWHSLVKNSDSQPSVAILPVGKMPPNPAELLEGGRMERLIAEARKEYDIVLLDCPPVNIVVDTQIVGQWADRTLFVVRAGLLDKSALVELNEFYEEKKFRNMSVLLNGTTAAHSRYYTYGNYQNYND